MMATQIQIIVAQADLILCTIAHNIPRLLMVLAVGFVVGSVIRKCVRR